MNGDKTDVKVTVDLECFLAESVALRQRRSMKHRCSSLV